MRACIVAYISPANFHFLNYKHVGCFFSSVLKYGIEVDKTHWKAGATGQGDFLVTAQTAGMMWSWSVGYKFVAFEGAFAAPTVTTAKEFKSIYRTNWNRLSLHRSSFEFS